ncbi:MAG: T9SS type A sorting domain-containing protein [Owenweeksia sp.]|nr:T9SS type A sorting domain-containing protein [Owenweeksia sp.]
MDGRYSVRITDATGCEQYSDTTGYYIGMKELPQGLKFRIYPNPAHEVVNLAIESNANHQFTLSIFNNLGQLVNRQKMRVQGQSLRTIDVGNLAPGVYLFDLEGQELLRASKNSTSVSPVMHKIGLMLFLVCGQCHSPQALLSPEVQKATFQKTSHENGDKSIQFVVRLKGINNAEISLFRVNGNRLATTAISHSQNSLRITAYRNYPAPPGGRGVDPLPPGEPGQLLYFQDAFRAIVILRKGEYSDTLRIEKFEEIQ